MLRESSLTRRAGRRRVGIAHLVEKDLSAGHYLPGLAVSVFPARRSTKIKIGKDIIDGSPADAHPREIRGESV